MKRGLFKSPDTLFGLLLNQEDCCNCGYCQTDYNRFHIPSNQVKGADPADRRCRDNGPWDQGAPAYPDCRHLSKGG